MPLTQERFPPSSRPVATYAAAGLLLVGLAGIGTWVGTQVAMVPSAVPPSMAVTADSGHKGLSTNAHAQLRLSSAGPGWRELSNAQRQILMPLRDRWESMGALTKRRWLVLADRYPKMDDGERTKLVTRMHTWAGLSAQQRNQARLNFESAKRLSPSELQTKWDEYQALSEAEKQRLAEQAKKTKATAAKKSKRRLARMPAPKTEVVSPSPAATTSTPPKPVSLQAPDAAAQPARPPYNVVPEVGASSQPVVVPQAVPIVELPPLPPISSQEVTPSATPAPHTSPTPTSGH